MRHVSTLVDVPNDFVCGPRLHLPDLRKERGKIAHEAHEYLTRRNLFYRLHAAFTEERAEDFGWRLSLGRRSLDRVRNAAEVSFESLQSRRVHFVGNQVHPQICHGSDVRVSYLFGSLGCSRERSAANHRHRSEDLLHSGNELKNPARGLVALAVSRRSARPIS